MNGLGRKGQRSRGAEEQSHERYGSGQRSGEDLLTPELIAGSPTATQDLSLRVTCSSLAIPLLSVPAVSWPFPVESQVPAETGRNVLTRSTPFAKL